MTDPALATAIAVLGVNTLTWPFLIYTGRVRTGDGYRAGYRSGYADSADDQVLITKAVTLTRGHLGAVADLPTEPVPAAQATAGRVFVPDAAPPLRDQHGHFVSRTRVAANGARNG